MVEIRGQENLRSIRDNKRITFIIDKEKKIFHSKKCPLLDEECLHDNNLLPIKYAVKKNYQPCNICNPQYNILSQGEKLCELARGYGIETELKDPYIYAYTLLDEWFFNYKDSPVTLHHKNLYRRTDGRGVRLPGDFHKQEYSFEFPSHALAYIRNHTNAIIRYRLIPRTAQLRLETAVDGSKKLFCGSEEISPGDYVKVLLPEGWQEIQMNEENGCWRIVSYGFEEHSPIGLFAKVDSVVRKDS